MSSFIYGQEYMDKITENACECSREISEISSNQEYTARLGICMIEAATPYKKELKKNHGIDFKNIDTQGEELGRLIGMKMTGTCPDVIAKMASMLDENGEIKVEESVSLTGEIVAINKEKFVEFTIKNEKGKTSKFYWLSQIHSDIDIENRYDSLLNKKVSIQYVKEEFFDSRINEYKLFNVLEKIVFI